MKRYHPLHILCHNGWEWLCYDKDKLSNATEYEQYAAEFLGDSYSSTVVAIVSQRPEHLNLDGCYGVLWLEAIYENDRNGLSYGDMEDMMSAIENAEDNLLTIGMPFTDGYQFHGRNRANKNRRNDKLRRLYGLKEIEKQDWEKRDKR